MSTNPKNFIALCQPTPEISITKNPADKKMKKWKTANDISPACLSECGDKNNQTTSDAQQLVQQAESEDDTHMCTAETLKQKSSDFWMTIKLTLSQTHVSLSLSHSNISNTCIHSTHTIQDIDMASHGVLVSSTLQPRHGFKTKSLVYCSHCISPFTKMFWVTITTHIYSYCT